MNLSLYFHTVRYLKIKQIIFQIFRRVYKPQFSFQGAFPSHRLLKKPDISFLNKNSSLIGAGKFKFFGDIGDLKNLGWNGATKEKLWRYNQHYFDDLNALDSTVRSEWHQRLLIDWLENNPCDYGIGWDPYPISLRIVNWIKWDLGLDNPSPSARQSLFLQGLTLEKKMEYHILGNHLFANAKALLFFGCYFDGKDSQRLLRKGFTIINKELGIQVLDDGGNFELSPMYHCIFLEDVLDIINIIRNYRPSEYEKSLLLLEKVVPTMLRWLQKMILGDDEVSCFNDSATNVAPHPSEVFEYANQLGFTIKENLKCDRIRYEHLKSSGFVSVDRGELKMILDVGRLGPDYLLAHAHADTLSFELSIGKQRILVNSGTSNYHTDPRRGFERSTRAHNTVEIDNCSSSEVWSTFRVARRAYPGEPKVDYSEKLLNIQCSHNGYRWLKGAPVQTRNWMVAPKKVIITDKITGLFKSAVSRFIFHSDLVIRKKDKKTFVVKLPTSAELILHVKSGIPKLVNWEHTTEFGFLYETSCLEVVLTNGESELEIS